MSRNNRYEKARHRAERVHGFVCPTCDSLVPRGYEICYNCGEDAMLGSSSSRSGSTYGDYETTFCLAYIFVIIAPIIYLLSKITIVEVAPFVQLITGLPIAVIFITSLVQIIRYKTNLGCFFGPIQLWNFIFSALAIINMIKFHFN